MPRRRVVWVTDASPWGLGGIQVVGGHITEYFYSRLQASDFKKFHAAPGLPKFMPIWEALALLVAAKAWGPALTELDDVSVKLDNLGVVFNVARHRASHPEVSKILRELALVEMSFPLSSQSVSTAEHIPGISNVIPDALSRQWDPIPLPFPPGCWHRFAFRRSFFPPKRRI